MCVGVDAWAVAAAVAAPASYAQAVHQAAQHRAACVVRCRPVPSETPPHDERTLSVGAWPPRKPAGCAAAPLAVELVEPDASGRSLSWAALPVGAGHAVEMKLDPIFELLQLPRQCWMTMCAPLVENLPLRRCTLLGGKRPSAASVSVACQLQGPPAPPAIEDRLCIHWKV
eukprot:CAMPEP_0172867544 /NCGR_PEP_ID=MMETSP1075-20121228/83926_1 /TAXON_ID=2916 /ORGANISM="Ceratium fusus, Strain PA161109" /LENGTH=170 /DNA_ID=CAMNT_0013716933 /DNA_START=744 /DNA_END=1257 /DNA_ORIENTATION=-